MIFPVGVIANNNHCVHCNELSITGLKIHIGKELLHKSRVHWICFRAVSRVKYTVTNPITGVEASNCSSYCQKCIKLGKCIFSCGIKNPGIYDVSMTAYGPGRCSVNKVLKDVIINY